MAQIEDLIATRAEYESRLDAKLREHFMGPILAERNALKEALREALDGWWECRGDLEQTGQERAIKRIAELRTQFLDDK